MKLYSALLLSSLTLASLSHAAFIIDGDFSGTGFAGVSTVSLIGDGDGVVSGPTPVIDQGWYVESPDTQWVYDTVDERAERDTTVATKFSAVAIAQIVTSTASNGDDLTVSFDYIFDNPDVDDGFAYILFGFDYTGNANGDPSDWFGNSANQDAINLGPDAAGVGDFLTDNGTVTGVGNYDRYVLDTLQVTANAGSSAIVYSETVTLTRDYEYFGIAFSGGAPDADDLIAVDNVSLNAVPEPSTFGLLAGCFALVSVVLRRRG